MRILNFSPNTAYRIRGLACVCLFFKIGILNYGCLKQRPWKSGGRCALNYLLSPFSELSLNRTAYFVLWARILACVIIDPE